MQANPTSPPSRPAGTTPPAHATLTLSGAPLAPDVPLVLTLQSLSDSGLAVLSGTPAGSVDATVLSAVPEGEVLTFVVEHDGGRQTLQASLVWVELTGAPGGGARIELIVDTGEQGGWAALPLAAAAE